MEEIHTLELDNTEKQAQLERILREKRAAESELEKVCAILQKTTVHFVLCNHVQCFIAAQFYPKNTVQLKLVILCNA